MLLPVCTDPMIDGPSGVFKPSGDGTVSESGPDGYSMVTFSNDGVINLKTSTPAQLTVFYLRVGRTCSDGSPLKVEVKYFLGDQAETVVSG